MISFKQGSFWLISLAAIYATPVVAQPHCQQQSTNAPQISQVKTVSQPLRVVTEPTNMIIRTN